MSDYDSDRAPGQGFTTVQLHHGQGLDTDHRARAPPIYASTSFAFKSAEHGAKLFALQELGPIYTRIMNPTAHVLEYRLSKLEGSGCNLDGAHPSAVATASGVSAQLQALLTICQCGDSIIAAGDLYGGTYAQFKHTFPLMGITVKFINGQNLDELKAGLAELGDIKYAFKIVLSDMIDFFISSLKSLVECTCLFCSSFECVTGAEHATPSVVCNGVLVAPPMLIKLLIFDPIRELCYLLEQKIITIVDGTLTRENFECLLAGLPTLKLRKTSRNGAPTDFMSRILSDSEMDFDLHGAVAMKFLRIQG